MKKLEDFKEKIDNLIPDKELNNEDMAITYGIMASKDSKFNDIVVSTDQEIQELTGFLIFLKKLEAFTSLKITRGALYSIGIHFDSPGKAIIYAYYLHRKCKPNTTITLDMLTNDLFSNGMISEKQHNELWDAQKLNSEEEFEEAKLLVRCGPHDNLLDYLHTWDKDD